MLRILINILALISLLSAPVSGDVLNDIGAVNERAKGYDIQTKNVHEEDGKKKAQEFYKDIQSKEFQERINKDAEKLRKELSKKSGIEYKSQGATEAKDKFGMPGDERIYIFISSSMPLTTLRNYVASAATMKDVNISFIMRGLVGDKPELRPMQLQKFTNDMLKVNASCTGKCENYKVPVFIDPRLFRRYGIEKVPAVVYSKGGPDMLREEQTDPETSSEESAWVIYGDASLEYLLRKIKENIQ